MVNSEQALGPPLLHSGVLRPSVCPLSSCQHPVEQNYHSPLQWRPTTVLTFLGECHPSISYAPGFNMFSWNNILCCALQNQTSPAPTLQCGWGSLAFILQYSLLVEPCHHAMTSKSTAAWKLGLVTQSRSGVIYWLRYKKMLNCISI